MDQTKLIVEISDQGSEQADLDKNFILRKATRAILLNSNNEIALLNVVARKIYKLPGGGIEAAESLEQGLKREILEETGYDSEIMAPLGIVIETRMYPEDETGLHQITYCYEALAQSKKQPPAFTQKEIDEKYELIWLNPNTAQVKLEQTKASDYSGKFIVERELAILKAYLNHK